MKAIIHIGLKPGVLDPQGRAISRSLNDLGFDRSSQCPPRKSYRDRYKR